MRFGGYVEPDGKNSIFESRFRVWKIIIRTPAWLGWVAAAVFFYWTDTYRDSNVKVIK